MSKIKINYCLETKEKIDKKVLIGIKSRDKLVFIDDGYNTILLIFDNNVVMKRESDETINIINLGNHSNCEYYLKKYDKKIFFDINLKELVIENNRIYFEYQLNDENIKFELIYEVIKC